MTRQLFNIIYFFIISIIIFTITPIEFELFVLIFYLAWVMLLIGYGRKCNKLLISKFAGITSGVICAYIVFIIMADCKFKVCCDNILLICTCVINILILFAMNICIKKERKSELSSTLFSVRKYDLDRIEHFVLNVPVLGVNSMWGNGKSFVMDHLSNREIIKKEFEVIRIDLLTCNLDEIEITLINEFERILTKNRIFPTNSKEIKRMVENQSFLKQLQSMLFNNDQSVAADFGKIRDDVNKLDKKVLIIYEDIDRISNIDIIKKIFAISEKISGDRIHIIYQYDQENLEKYDLTRAYVEKYIPHVVNLTEMELREIVVSLWDDLGMDIIGMDKYDFVHMISTVPYDYYLQNQLGLNQNIKISFDSISIRKVRVFLEECKTLIGSNNYFSEKASRELLIKILFIKNFNYPQFAEFKISKTIEETMLFCVNGNRYTLTEILKEKKKGTLSEDVIKSIFQEQDNLDKLAILLYLGYKGIDNGDTDDERKPDAINIDIIEKREKNERINRILKNVLGNGKSEYTNAQVAIRKLEAEVFDLPDDEVVIAWNKYRNALFHRELEKDNHTIMLFGEYALLTVYKALASIGGSGEQWIKLLRLTELLDDKKLITNTIIEMMNCCDVDNKAVFLKAIKLFSNYDTIGNLNASKEYQNFLTRFADEIFRLGYSRSVYFESHNTELFSLLPDRLEESVKLLESMVEVIKTEREKMFIAQAKEECDLIISFLNKNIEIIKSKEAARIDHSPEFKTHISAKKQNQEELDRLMTFLGDTMEECDVKAFYNEVEESYKQEKISPEDLHYLASHINKSMK